MSVSEYKTIGKANFDRDSGYMILIAFLLSLVESAGTQLRLNNTSSESGSEAEDFALVIAFIIFAVYSIINIALLFLVKPAIQTGCNSCLIQNFHGQKIVANNIGRYFRKDVYQNVVIVYLMKYLVEFLYTLCFIIPGIIKSYEYFCVPYLVALRPDMNEKEVRELSSDIMRGYKMDLFMLRLSFIGWHLLSIFTFGILEIVYVSPYQKASETAFFFDVYLRKCAQQNTENQRIEG